MKPILVQNNDEWLRLAPVLDRLKYSWVNLASINRFNPFEPRNEKQLPSIEGVKIRLFHNKTIACELTDVLAGETQSVDEFLQANQAITNDLPIDWEAKYKELEQKYNDTEAGFSFYQTEMKILVQENDKLRAENERLKQKATP